jgi:GntP family gluconate:H+ symporter
MFLVALLAVVAGGSMAHSLVPPTPGPLMVAEQLDLDLGVMIIAGLILGVITMSVGYLYACWANKKFKIPLRPSAMAAAIEEEADPNRILPSLKLALLPILVPFLLIAVGTVVKSGGLAPLSSALKLEMPLANVTEILLLLGDKNIALAVGAVIAVLVALKYRPAQMAIREVAQTALAGGGIIILITAAGAAFGGMMKATDIAAELSEMFPQTGSALLLVAFCLTALVRVAQGSATVSMLTSIGIIAPLLSEIELGFHPVYLALAIGCGSKPGPWMNDSGFWVISKMSGMTEGETLKTFSVMLTLMGVAGFIVVLVASKVLPLM